MRNWVELRGGNRKGWLLAGTGRFGALCTAVLVLAGGIAPVHAAPNNMRNGGQTAKVTTENESAGYRVESARGFAPFTPPALGPIDVSRFAFTAPGKPAGQKTQTVDRNFSFTPSGATERDDRRSVSVGVSTRSLTTAQTPVRASGTGALASTEAEPGVGPSGYDVGLSVGYRGFAISGGVTRLDSGVTGGQKQGVDLGLGYAARNWKTGVRASVERGSVLPVPQSEMSERVAVEAGGALALSPSLSVGGTVRYRMAPDHPTLLDPNKDERTLLLGGALAF